MKLLYSEVLTEEREMDDQQRLINIRRLEQRLFASIEMEQSMEPCDALFDLRSRIDSLQTEYSRTSI